MMHQMNVKSVPRIVRAWLAGVFAILLLAVASQATAATTELKLRERVIELEDERDTLQEKYDGIMAQYKTVKGEIRASIDLQKRLDEALSEAAELQARSGDASGLARGLEKCEFARENRLVDLMLTESSLNEMIRKYRDLELLVHKEDCSAIKRDLVQYRDQAEHCMTDVEGLKKANGELSRRAAEQATRLAELEDVEGELIKASAELEVVMARNKELMSDSIAFKELEKERVVLQAELAGAQSAFKASKNELVATKAALNGLLDSLDSRLQLEALKEAHEKEILPFWLDSLLTRALAHASALYARHVQPVCLIGLGSADAARAYVGGQIELMLKGTSGAVHALLHPVATRADGIFGEDMPARMLLDRAIEVCSRHLNVINVEGRRMRALAGSFQRGAVGFISRKLSVALANISYFEDKRDRIDVDSVSNAIFYAMIAMITLPLVVMTARSLFNALMYYFRQGTAVVIVTNESETIDAIEESIGYKFRNRDYAVQALEQSQSLHQVGLAIINLILANELKGTDSRMEVEQRSMLSCVDKIVRPGPGYKSIRVAKEQKAHMFICLLAAVFRDSDESVEKVMRVWGSSSEIPTHVEVTNDRYIPTIDDDDEEEMPDIVHSGMSSSSSVSAGEAPDVADVVDAGDDGRLETPPEHIAEAKEVPDAAKDADVNIKEEAEKQDQHEPQPNAAPGKARKGNKGKAKGGKS